MRIIRTHETKPDELTAFEREQVYNALDVCQTLEIFEVIQPQLDNMTAATYAFSRDLQGPVLEMKLRGVLVDQQRRAEVLETYYEQLDQIETNLERIAVEGCGMSEFNWRSTRDVQRLLYDNLGIPPIRYQGRVTTDRAARDRLFAYPTARPILAHLNALADIGKKIGVLKTAIDPDGRIRTSYNIAGTNTGRFSSSVSEFGTGGNLQNVEELLRSVLIADPGMKFAKFDAKSGESFCVGAILWNLFRDSRYLDACQSGDLHTAAARMCWPSLGWTGDIRADKAVAEQLFYRHHSYRQTSKKLGHASNYAGQPNTIATQTGMPQDIVEQFQPLYFTAYPSIKKWHAWVAQTIKERGHLVNLVGRKRWFLGRRTEPATLREAIAYDPQGSLAQIVNQGMLNVWHERTALLMLQDHDAITVQYPERLEDKIVPAIIKQLAVPVELADGRVMTIPYDAQVGWNKGSVSEDNPDGLKDYKGTDTRKRSKQRSILDRPITSLTKIGF